MDRLIENRRDFLKRATFLAISMPFLTNCATAQTASSELNLIKANANTSPSVNWCGAIDAPDNVSWKTALSKKSDQDEPMIISGTVFEADGRRVAPNVLIYFYHTDSDGFYNRKRDGEPLHGHFRGWLLTDKKGRYEFSTIKPASYPNRTFAAHIHMTITTKNLKEDSIDSILFEGDKFITELERNLAGKKGGFNPILNLEKGSDGILRGTRDIQLWKV